jgi:hypothetical protein
MFSVQLRRMLFKPSRLMSLRTVWRCHVIDSRLLIIQFSGYQRIGSVTDNNRQHLTRPTPTCACQRYRRCRTFATQAHHSYQNAYLHAFRWCICSSQMTPTVVLYSTSVPTLPKVRADIATIKRILEAKKVDFEEVRNFLMRCPC